MGYQDALNVNSHPEHATGARLATSRFSTTELHDALVMPGDTEP